MTSYIAQYSKEVEEADFTKKSNFAMNTPQASRYRDYRATERGGCGMNEAEQD